MIDYTVEVRNRFKGLDLIEYLMNYGWRFMTIIVQQTGIKNIAKKKKCKKAKWLSEEALQVVKQKAKEKGKDIPN